MAAVDLTFLKNYFGKWVAITKDEKKVIVSGNSLKEIREKVKIKNYKNPIFTKVIDFSRFIP